MNTDKQIYLLFSVAPAELYILLGSHPPGPVRARSEVFKEVETRADLVVEPNDDQEATLLVEFQGYRDRQFLAKTMVRCGLYRMQQPTRPMRCHIIYLDKSCESAAVDDGGLFQPQVHYLPDLFAALMARQPDSALLSVLRPLLVDDEQQLTSQAVADYEKIRISAELDSEQRETWLDVFHCWLMVRLRKSIEELRAMVLTQLPEIEELPWGKELKQRWTAEGRVEGRAEGRVDGRVEGRAAQLRVDIERAEQQVKLLDQMFATGELSEPAYRRLSEESRRHLLEAQVELGRLESAKETPPGTNALET